MSEPLDYHQIMAARREEHTRLMKEYDRTVYYPALRDLRMRCVADGGHRNGRPHDNGFGWSWLYCGRCGARYNIEGPDGERKDEGEE